MNIIDLKVGLKIILLNSYHGEYTAVTTDIITKKNKFIENKLNTLETQLTLNQKTFSTEKKQLLSNDSFDNFYIRWQYSRKAVEADISIGAGYFSPQAVEVYTKKRYKEIYNSIEKEKLRRERREKEHKEYEEAHTKTFKEYNDLQDELYQKNTIILRDKFVNTICKKCKYYNFKTDTCMLDDKFYNVGKLSRSKKRFFSNMSMCKWKPIEKDISRGMK